MFYRIDPALATIEISFTDSEPTDYVFTTFHEAKAALLEKLHTRAHALQCRIAQAQRLTDPAHTPPEEVA